MSEANNHFEKIEISRNQKETLLQKKRIQINGCLNSNEA